MRPAYEMVVVGAGPGGIAAATVAAEAGMSVCLLDGNPAPGGQIWRGLRTETARSAPHGRAYAAWTARLHASGCTVLCGWQVVSAPYPGVLRLEKAEESRDLRYERLILATGARERLLPFPGWTLPGVMGAGGLQALLKAGLRAEGKRIVVAGTGPLLLAAAAGAAQAGAQVVGIYEQAPLSQLSGFALSALFSAPGKLAEGAAYRWRTRDAEYRLGAWITRAAGKDRVEQVTVSDGVRGHTIACDWLACGFHLVPNLELPRLLGCAIEDGFVMADGAQQSSVPGVACVGELTGIGGLDKALLEGQIAGWTAAGRPAKAQRLSRALRGQLRFVHSMNRAFALRAELRTLSEPATVVCRCEDVTHEALLRCTSRREARLHARCGMGACQGRVCGSAAEFLYGWQPAGSRPPVFPARVETLAAEAQRP